jgi:hypothetical protein
MHDRRSRPRAPATAQRAPGPEGRIHPDLAPVDPRPDEAIERVLGMRASQVADRRNPDGTGWVVLADPAGNLFYIVRSDEERSLVEALDS